VAQSPYVMLRPLVYITSNEPCGSIGPSAERGAKAHRLEPGHASTPDPCLDHDTSCPETLLWVVWSLLGGVRTPSNGFRLLYLGGLRPCAQGSYAFLRKSGPDDAVSENTTPTAHKISLGLFSVRPGIAARASCLHTVVRGTPDPGCRQWPPGPPQGRERACRWGQSLIGDCHAASARPLLTRDFRI
jgi:hypothetical protein